MVSLILNYILYFYAVLVNFKQEVKSRGAKGRGGGGVVYPIVTFNKVDLVQTMW